MANLGVLVLNSEKEFREFCEFAESTGWKKTGKSEEGIIYENDFLGKKVAFQKSYQKSQ